jgi:uncharacterized membrane protein YqaE (UPF0057 family)
MTNRLVTIACIKQNSMKKILLSLVAIATILSSCSVEKRVHTDGYHIEWYSNNDKSKIQHQAPAINLANVAAPLNKDNHLECELTVNETEVVNSTPAAIELTPSKTSEVANESARANRKAMRKAIKELRTELKQQTQSTNPVQLFSGKSNVAQAELANPDQPDKVLLVILAFFIPPLAVYLYEGSWTKRCTTNLILTLLCGLPGLIHALIVILE